MFDWIVLAACAGFLAFSFFLLRTARADAVVVSYERLYVQNLARIELLIAKVSGLGLLVEKSESAQIIENYQKTVSLTESFVESLHGLRFQTTRDETVRAMEPMIVSIEAQVDKLIAALEPIVKPLPHLKKTLDSLKGPIAPTSGCYFCSKPYSPRSFKEVRITYRDSPVLVHGCAVCRGKLRARGSVEVLHFTVEGKQTHWSEVASYDPRHDYWRLKDAKKPYKVTLTLVSANAEP